MRKEITFDSPEQFAKVKERLDNLKKVCPNKQCGGKGHIVIEKEDGTYFRDCPDCTEKVYEIIEYMKANIAEDYLVMKLIDMKHIFTPEVYKRAGEVISKISRLSLKYSLLIDTYDDAFSYGSATAANLIAKQFIDEKFDTYVLNFNDFVNTMFDFGGTAERNLAMATRYEKILKVNILVIDHFGEDGTDRKWENGSFVYKKVSHFLNLRKAQGRFTLIATDFSREKFYMKNRGSLSKLMEENYLPFYIQCMTGKYKHSVMTKLAKSDIDCLALFTKEESKVVNITTPTTPTANIPEDTTLDNIGKDRPANVRTKR